MYHIPSFVNIETALWKGAVNYLKQLYGIVCSVYCSKQFYCMCSKLLETTLCKGAVHYSKQLHGMCSKLLETTTARYVQQTTRNNFVIRYSKELYGKMQQREVYFSFLLTTP
jgi:hypothetical protein